MVMCITQQVTADNHYHQTCLYHHVSVPDEKASGHSEATTMSPEDKEHRLEVAEEALHFSSLGILTLFMIEVCNLYCNINSLLKFSHRTVTMNLWVSPTRQRVKQWLIG